MKTLLLSLSIASLVFCLNCESEPEDENACNPDVLAVTAFITINGENACYSQGGLGFNNSSNIMSLILFSPRNGIGGEIDVQFSIPSQGFQFNEPYPVASGEYNNTDQVSGGTILLMQDNYPSDPNLLQYKGTIDLTFQSRGGGDIIDVSGTFSFERP